ncbi:hypothetical protein VE25_07515 [Devosia geojensis]|uniref:Uncharacterized protein n=1 Tax=Devosia geojensis TaxID=443610 RepID=A0A0F5FU39_9HYPH|nr:hypothetical protein [Devosia geojensis]KKB12391.1 hypothetical protein VE25_07515 [Devosia geojensis]
MNNVISINSSHLGSQDGSDDGTPLHSGGGGGTSDDMSIVDAKIAAAEARTDTKFVQVLSRLDNLDSDIARNTRGIIPTIILTGISVVALVVAVFAWGNGMFSTGMSAQSIADQAARGVEQRLSTELQASAQRYDVLEQRLDTMSAENSANWDRILEALSQSDNESDPSRPQSP